MNKNKTVGIITMHGVINYGSILQAYALQRKITDFGYTCEIIDYVFPNNHHRKHLHTNTFRHKLKKCAAKILATIFKIGSEYNSIQMRANLKDFARTHLKLTKSTFNSPQELERNAPTYDIYVTGSDQVWNTKYVGDDTSFLLSFVPDGAQKIAYSSSFAQKQLDTQYEAIYKKWLSEYAHISVRELNGSHIIHDIIGVDVPTTLDPTLLLTRNEWSEISESGTQHNRKYILAYVLSYAFSVTPYIYDLLRWIQSKFDCGILFIGKVPHELEDCAVSVGNIKPTEFIDLFMNASFVVTSSFHGTAFAINFGIPFYSVVDKNPRNDDRQMSLLDSLGISDRGIRVDQDFKDLNIEFDATPTQARLNQLRERSIRYLQNSLNDDA